MKRVLQGILATMAGVIAGGLTVAAVEWISTLVYPPPEGLDFQDREQLVEYVRTLPLGAFLFVLAAWAAGAFVAAGVARRLAPGHRALPALIAVAIQLLFAVMNLMMIPHPIWFAVAGVALYPVFGLLGLGLLGGAIGVVRCSRTIAASKEKVFATVATPEEFSRAVPGIQKIEFLSAKHQGVGTRFRETREFRGREAATELEITEQEENESIRIVSDAGGTLWDTRFTVSDSQGQTRLDMVMVARAYQLSSRFVTPLIMGIVARAVEDDLDATKRYCEQG